MAHSPPISVAFCITELEIGGAEKMLVELVTRLDRARWAPVVYALGPRPTGGDEALALRLEAAGVPVHFLGGRGMVDAPRVLARLRKLLLQQRPAILQNFLWHANMLGAVAGSRAGVPHILSGIRVAERRRNLHRWLARRVAHTVEKHVCVSQAVADFSRQQAGVPGDRIVVIPNGVEILDPPPAALDLTTLGFKPGRRAILFLGRLDPQKRVDWLLAQMPQVLSRLPDHDLLLVGRGPLRAALEAQAARLGLAERVHLVGWRDDAPALLAASDVLVLTSAAEGMANAVLEAMAAGKPVVATEAEGVREQLGPAAAAQVVPRDAAEAFQQRLVEIASDPQLAQSLGQQNRARAKAEFSLEKMAARYQSLYEALLR